MNQGQIVCSFCSAEFTVPPGLNEAVCPKCGKATPLFTSQLGVEESEEESQHLSDEQWTSDQPSSAPPPPPLPAQPAVAIAPPPPPAEPAAAIAPPPPPAEPAVAIAPPPPPAQPAAAIAPPPPPLPAQPVAAIAPPPPPLPAQPAAAIAPPPPPQDEQPPASPNGAELLGRISLKQVPATEAGPVGRSGSQPAIPRENGLESLAFTDNLGQLLPETVQGETGATTESEFAPPAPADGAGFAMGSGPVTGMPGVENMNPLMAQEQGAGGSQPNLLADLDATLDAHGFDDEIPEAEPLVMDPNMEIPEEFSDFFSSEETTGLNLPSDGAIAVCIPTAPIQERMRNEAVAPSAIEDVASAQPLPAAGEPPVTAAGKPAAAASPALRRAVFIGAGVLVLGALLIWLLL